MTSVRADDEPLAFLFIDLTGAIGRRARRAWQALGRQILEEAGVDPPFEVGHLVT